MHERFVDFLRDPIDGGTLALAVDEYSGSDVISGRLVGQSGAMYPIREGIPRFVKTSYATSFATQWNRFSRVQVDSHRGGSYSRDRFVTEVVNQVGDVAGQVVVDAGCGAGRFSEIARDLGATVLAVDLSEAVDAARSNLSDSINCCVVQADITRLPMDMALVNGLFSIGVVQHTPNPYQTVSRLAEQLVQGAWFALTAYGKGPFTKLHAKYFARGIVRHMSNEKLLRLIEAGLPRVFGPLERIVSTPMVGRGMSFALPMAIYPKRQDLDYDSRLQESILDTFDMLAPQYDEPLRPEKTVQLLEQFLAEINLQTSRPLVLSGKRM